MDEIGRKRDRILLIYEVWERRESKWWVISKNNILELIYLWQSVSHWDSTWQLSLHSRVLPIQCVRGREEKKKAINPPQKNPSSIIRMIFDFPILNSSARKFPSTRLISASYEWFWRGGWNGAGNTKGRQETNVRRVHKILWRWAGSRECRYLHFGSGFLQLFPDLSLLLSRIMYKTQE